MKSESIKNLADALSKAQAEIKAAPMDATNPFLKNRFASLGSVIETIRPVFAKHGLAVSQFPTGDGNNIGLRNILTHSSGEWMEETITMPAGEEKGKSLAQVSGSIITYLRRYSLAAIAGIYADEDDDGNAPAKQAQTSKAKSNGKNDDIITDKAWKEWEGLCERAADHLDVPALERDKLTLTELREEYRTLDKMLKAVTK